MKEFDRWFRQAARNLDSARRDLDLGFYEWACFKAQQAAELAVKALLRARGGRSVLKLLELVEAELGVPVPSELKGAAAELDHYYIPPRYPDAEGSPYEFFTKDMAARAVRLAEGILQWAHEAWSAGR